MFVNYAHRGASTYCPENTMLSFYTGMYMGANGIETDVQITKDGVLVLFHDDDTERILGVKGAIADFTYAELLEMNVKNGKLTDKVPTFEDFIIHFRNFEITFAIELKVVGVEKAVADMIYKYGIEDKVIITSFKFECIEEMKKCAPALKVGYLTTKTDESVTDALRAIGAEQICPYGPKVTRELVDKWHAMGFNVRAWGIADTDIMTAVYEAGADGMTVNFPDKLTELLGKEARK